MNRKKIIVFSSLLIALVFAGCASTDISSVYQPNIKSEDFSYMMVAVPFQDLNLRKESETLFLNYMNASGIRAIRAIDVLPPIKQYSTEEISSILKKNGVTAVMIISLSDSYTEQSYIPQSSNTTGSATISGNIISGQSRTTTSGGFYVSKPRLKFEIVLFIPGSDDIMWKATTFTRGNAFADEFLLLDSLAQEVISKFVLDSR